MINGSGLPAGLDTLLGGLLLGLLAGRIMAEAAQRIPAWMDWQLAGETGPSPLLESASRCRHAGIISLLSGVLMSLVVWRFGWSVTGASASLLTTWLITLAMIDHETQLLPDCLTLSGLWGGLLLAAIMPLHDPATAIVGATCGYLMLRIPAAAYESLTGQCGMGHGDFKLLAMIGAWLGPAPLLTVVTMASIGGALWAMTKALRSGQAVGIPLAFGPWLASAGWITLMWEPYLLDPAL